MRKQARRIVVIYTHFYFVQPSLADQVKTGCCCPWRGSCHWYSCRGRLGSYGGWPAESSWPGGGQGSSRKRAPGMAARERGAAARWMRGAAAREPVARGMRGAAARERTRRRMAAREPVTWTLRRRMLGVAARKGTRQRRAVSVGLLV